MHGTSVADGANGAAEWRNGYPVVGTAFIGVAIAVLASWSMGLFIEPIQREFGWSRGEISASLMTMSVMSFFGAPFVGRMIDIIGTRRIALTGMVIYCASLASIGFANGARWQWWAIWFAVAIGFVLIKPTLWAVAVSRRFDAQRGLALAVTMCGSGVALIFMPSIVNALIADHGWRMSYVAIGAAAAVISLPMILLFLRDRPLPKAESRAEGGEGDDAIAAKAEMWASLRSGRFIRLALGAVIMTVATIGLQVHFIPLMGTQGVDRSTAAMMAGLIGVGSITGRVVCGFLMDRWRGQLVGGIFFALPALSSLLLLNYHGGLVAGGITAFIQGLALGAEMDVITFLTSRYFGLRNYGTLVGTIMAGVGLANGVGPTIAGYVFDATGSYQLFVMATIPTFLVGAALIFTLGDYAPRRAAGAQGDPVPAGT